MKQGHCPFCGQKASLAYAACPKPGTDMFFCRDCRLLFQDPLLDAGDLHDQEYFASWGDEASVEAMKREDFRAKLSFLEKFRRTPEKSLLDIGAAQGHFMAVARESGWDVLGIEMSGAGLGSQKIDRDIVFDDFLKHDFCGRTFSTVTSFSVLEHVADPRAFIEKVISLLKPQGIWLVMTPDAQSFSRRVLGRRWPHFNPPHLIIYSRSFFRQLKQRYRLQVEFVGRALNVYRFYYLLQQSAVNGGFPLCQAAKMLKVILPESIKNKRIKLSGGNLLAVFRKY